MPKSTKSGKISRLNLSKQRRQLALRGSSSHVGAAHQQLAATYSKPPARPWGASTHRRRGPQPIEIRLASVSWSGGGGKGDKSRPPKLRIHLSGDVDAGTLANPDPVLEFWPPLPPVEASEHDQDDVEMQQDDHSSDEASSKLCLVTDKCRYVLTRNGQYLFPSSVTTAMLLRCSEASQSSSSHSSSSLPASSANTRTLHVLVRSAMPPSLLK